MRNIDGCKSDLGIGTSPRGPMDKALVYETKDSRFDPGRGLKHLAQLFCLDMRNSMQPAVSAKCRRIIWCPKAGCASAAYHDTGPGNIKDPAQMSFNGKAEAMWSQGSSAADGLLGEMLSMRTHCW